MTDKERVQTTIYLPEKLRQKLRFMALVKNVSMNDLILEAIAEHYKIEKE